MNNLNQLLPILHNMKSALENVRPAEDPGTASHGLCYLLHYHTIITPHHYAAIWELLLKYQPKLPFNNKYWFPVLAGKYIYSNHNCAGITQEDIDICITPRLTIINNVIKDLK